MVSKAVGIVALVLLGFADLANADDFERLDTESLEKIARGEGATSHASITFREIEALPNALPDSRSALLVVQTGDGRLSRLLVSPAYRKTKGEKAALKPVLLIERLETFETGKNGSRSAKTSGLMVFNDFRVDLDNGQIVPVEEGEDLVFQADTNNEGLLKTVGSAKLWTLDAPFVFPKPSSGPSAGRAILPKDFEGKFILDADGRFKGVLELNVGDDKSVKGRFRSEPGGSVYPVDGAIASDTPHRLQFVIHFPRIEQDFDGYLATEGKATIAGTFVMQNRTFGFHAERDSNQTSRK